MTSHSNISESSFWLPRDWTAAELEQIREEVMQEGKIVAVGLGRNEQIQEVFQIFQIFRYFR